MPVTSKVYGLAQQGMLNGEIDFDTAPVYVMLTTATYVPAQDTHRYRGDVSNEVTGAGYTAGGQALTGKTVTYDAATNTLKLDCADVTWANSTITARYAVFYVQVGADLTTPLDDPLLCYWDFGADVSSSAGPFTLTINAAGLVTLQAA